MTGITQQKCSLKLLKWEQMIQICGGVQTHTLETVLTLNIVESCEFLFDLTVMFICVTVCVRTHLCACVCVCQCVSLLVYLSVSLRPFSFPDQGLRGLNSMKRSWQPISSHGIDPTSPCVCVHVCFPINAHVLSTKPLLISLIDRRTQKDSKKTGKCVIYDEVKAIGLMAVRRHF